MPNPVYLVTISEPLRRAFVRGNSTATIFSENSRTTGYFSPRLDEPPTADTRLQAPGTPYPDDGVYPAGQPALSCPAGVFVQPYAEGDDDSVFWMRLWGWRQTVMADNYAVRWIPHLLSEVVCRVGNITGAPGSSTSVSVIDQERLCDGLMVTNGRGDVYSPGRNLAAHVLIPLRGCQKFQFDFAQPSPPHPQITMNAFWARF